MKAGRTQSKLDSVTDRGDLRKNNEKESLFTQYDIPKTVIKKLSDRGDTLQKNKIESKLVKKINKVINDQKSLTKTSDKEEDTKTNETFKRKDVKKKDKTKQLENQTRTYLDLTGRRHLREQYTLKNDKPKGLIKNDVNPEKEKGNDKDEKKSVGENSKSNYSVKSEKSKDTPKRRPIIKTITLKNNNKVYKAVTFGETKENTHLQIHMPTSFKKNVSKATETSFKYKREREILPSSPCTAVPSKVLMRERAVQKEINRKRFVSPDIQSNHSNSSPATEVAKWAPYSFNAHTKPYYEAWVNTKLAATSKCSKEETEEVRKTLRYERISSPELYYENFKDERYTGKIKIKTKLVRRQERNLKKPTSNKSN